MSDTLGLDHLLGGADPDYNGGSTAVIDAPPIPGAPAPPSTLPSGVHPLDQSTPIGSDGQPTEPDRPPSTGPAEHAHSGNPSHRRGAWQRDNEDALPVNQRAAHDFRTGVVPVNINNSSTAKVVMRRPGRKSVTIWIPAQVVLGGVLITPPNGVMWGNNEGELEAGAGSYLAIGDSVTLEVEAPVYIGLVPGTTQGYVQYLDQFDGPAGSIGDS